ncbi:MAG TPA: thioredoxin family protein [Ginsengibacter sp.]|nr:thioredoxin family protein [Ginsengibacter sp.]
MTYFASALIALLVAECLMAAGFGYPAVAAGAPETLVLVHIVAIGWLSLLMCGALFQFVPVLVARPLYDGSLPLPTLGCLVGGLIFLLLGFYLLGKLRFHHDDELPKNDFGVSYISIPRLFLSIISFAFALYMIPGLWGAPLKKISAFVPPMGTQDFNITSGGIVAQGSTSGEDALPHPEKYYERMKMYEPAVVVKYGMTTYFDYDEALAVARKLKKPLMLDFTGVNCVNCREMEGKVWIDPEIMKRLKNDFIIASLYVDVHSVYIPKEDQYYSEALKKTVKTLGEKNTDLQISTYNANTQPYYFFLDANEKRLIPEGYGYDPSVEKFKNLLDEALKNYKASGS